MEAPINLVIKRQTIARYPFARNAPSGALLIRVTDSHPTRIPSRFDARNNRIYHCRMKEQRTVQPNPYQAPIEVETPPRFWDKVQSWFGLSPTSADRTSFRRYPMIHCGIAFFVEHNEDSVLYAASPSNDQSDQPMQLIVNEVEKCLPSFFAAYPLIAQRSRGRQLVVRMIESYREAPHRWLREHPMGHDAIELAIATVDSNDR